MIGSKRSILCKELFLVLAIAYHLHLFSMILLEWVAQNCCAHLCTYPPAQLYRFKMLKTFDVTSSHTRESAVAIDKVVPGVCVIAGGRCCHIGCAQGHQKKQRRGTEAHVEAEDSCWTGEGGQRYQSFKSLSRKIFVSWHFITLNIQTISLVLQVWATSWFLSSTDFPVSFVSSTTNRRRYVKQ